MSDKKFYQRYLVYLTGVAVLISSMQVAVYCRAEDGHAVVEFFSSGCCDGPAKGDPSQESPPFLSEVFSGSTNNCGKCVDTLVSVHLTRVSRNHNLVHPISQVVPAATLGVINSGGVSICQSDSKRFAAVNSTLTSLRSIVIIV